MVKTKLVTAPTDYPVTRAEAKIHLRIPESENGDDTYIDVLIKAATQMAEDITNRKLITQIWDAFWDSFPDCREFQLPYANVTAVGSVKYKDENGTLQTMSGSDWIADLNEVPQEVEMAPAVAIWPRTEMYGYDTVQVRFTVGYGGADAVPAAIKQAILMMIGTWYANREDVVTATTVARTPQASDYLLMPYRVF